MANLTAQRILFIFSEGYSNILQIFLIFWMFKSFSSIKVVLESRTTWGCFVIHTLLSFMLVRNSKKEKILTHSKNIFPDDFLLAVGNIYHIIMCLTVTYKNIAVLLLMNADRSVFNYFHMKLKQKCSLYMQRYSTFHCALCNLGRKFNFYGLQMLSEHYLPRMIPHRHIQTQTDHITER